MISALLFRFAFGQLSCPSFTHSCGQARSSCMHLSASIMHVPCNAACYDEPRWHTHPRWCHSAVECCHKQSNDTTCIQCILHMMETLMSWQVPNNDTHVHIASEAQYRLFAVRWCSPLAFAGSLHLRSLVLSTCLVLATRTSLHDVLATGASACPDSVLATCSQCRCSS